MIQPSVTIPVDAFTFVDTYEKHVEVRFGTSKFASEAAPLAVSFGKHGSIVAQRADQGDR